MPFGARWLVLHNFPGMTDRELLHRIERSAGQRAGYKQLVRELGLGGGRERRMLVEQLDRMTARGELVKSDRDHWALPQAAARNDLLAGRLDVHRDGFGFVRPEARQAGGDDDIFIPPNEMNGAMQGDQVLVELAPPRPDGRRSGRIARVLSRRNPTVVGIFHYARQDHAAGNTVTPLDERVTQPILIPFGRSKRRPQAARLRIASLVRISDRQLAFRDPSDLEGMVVDVEITDWPTPTRPARGRVIEVLGRRRRFRRGRRDRHPQASSAPCFPCPMFSTEARAAAHLDPGGSAPPPRFSRPADRDHRRRNGQRFRRRGLRPPARRRQWELQVHIADVAQYVTPGSALDLEARLRGTSVYFPDRAVPMLPQELSSDICSLRPGEDRLVLSCIMMMDAEGEILDYEITQGVIRSPAA